jgi:hypothetical protein
MMNDDHMVGMRWVGLGLLLTLALACGRTKNTDKALAQGSAGVGGRNDGGAASGGTSASGSSPIPEGGQAGAPECPVTPATGEWFALGPDPYGLRLRSDGSQLIGEGCLGVLPSAADDSNYCSPLTFQADRGRSVAFLWDLSQVENAGLPYGVKMELTLAPERTAMAGAVWTTLGGLDREGQDIVLVRASTEPIPEATACSDGEPSGACFLGPLRSDRVHELEVVELGGGDLLLLWVAQRGQGDHIASVRFDAATTTWHLAKFIDDGEGRIESIKIAASPEGWAMVAYRRGSALLARAYDPTADAWSEERVVVEDESATQLQAAALFVYDGGDALLIVGKVDEQTESALSAHDYVADTATWSGLRVFADSPSFPPFAWAAGSDAARNSLAVWVRGGDLSQPHELWFSSRRAGETWTDPTLAYQTERQIVVPAVAVSAGTGIATWHEFGERIASSFYSFESSTWSAPLTVTSAQDTSLLGVRFNDAGTPATYFHDNTLASDTNHKSELENGSWSLPQAATTPELLGNSHWAMREGGALVVVPIRPNGTMAPAFQLPRCEGY